MHKVKTDDVIQVPNNEGKRRENLHECDKQPIKDNIYVFQY